MQNQKFIHFIYNISAPQEISGPKISKYNVSESVDLVHMSVKSAGPVGTVMLCTA